MNAPILEFQDVWKTFGNDKTKLDALKEIDLEIEENSVNLILGPSGSGKSTLLNLISLMDTPTKGKIFIKGKNTLNMSKSERSKFRRDEIGIIYQRDNLFPYLNILENVMVPMIVKDKEKAIKLLKIAGLTKITEFPDEIHIVEQQQTALVRAAINNPSILIADEPTGELNLEAADKLMNLIKSVGNKSTVLIASNNQDLDKYCDNIFYIKEGMILENK
ncbi:MAG: ABC transporter ATP-binding protein [Methanobacterium sp.]|uniref:ABC transporter ATP-binding protein n=1 Tax=Methanobacterium sp. TaxID=2164 RepID=UPI003D64A4C0|nr:ABC transporter ATP-binding protein [Methanobacterium sp.]